MYGRILDKPETGQQAAHRLVTHLEMMLHTLQRMPRSDPRSLAGMESLTTNGRIRGKSGPATSCYVVYAYTGDTRFGQWGWQAWSDILRLQRADGSLGVDDNPLRGVDTIFTGVNLGATLLVGQMTAEERRILLAKFDGICDFVVGDGGITHYANGNLALATTALFAYAWALKRPGAGARLRFFRAFENAADANNQETFGAIIERQGTTVRGDDGILYFTEQEKEGPVGFDPTYTHLQLSMAAHIRVAGVVGFENQYGMSDILYGIFNKLWPLVHPQRCTLETTGGTRRPAEGARLFTTPALPILAYGMSDPFLRTVIGNFTDTTIREYYRVVANPTYDVGAFSEFHDVYGWPMYHLLRS